MGCDGVFETLDHKELMGVITQNLGNTPITPEVLQKTAEILLDKLLAPDTSCKFQFNIYFRRNRM